MIFSNASGSAATPSTSRTCHSCTCACHDSGLQDAPESQTSTGTIDSPPTSMQPEPETDPPHCHAPAPSVSEVTLVEVTLLGDLVRILAAGGARQDALVAEEQRANAHRAVLAASAVRSELRAFNSASAWWTPLPLLSGEPFPAGVAHPSSLWALRRMSEDELRRVAAAYGIGDGDGDGETSGDVLRDSVALFLTGRRA